MNGFEKEDLSIVITAHNEGRLAKCSIESLLCAAKELETIGVKYKFYVNIDNGDKKTIDFFRMYNEQKIVVYNTSFGDPGLSRNYVSKKVNGKYIALIDADDAISENWLMDAYKIISSTRKNILVHPEVEIRYDKKKLCSVDIRTNLENSWQDNLALIFGNRWCSIVMGKRDIFLKSQYPVNGHGFGYEDYYFNCETVYKNVRHLVVKNTTAFCLLKEESTNKKAIINHEVLPYTRLFGLRRLKKYERFFGFPSIKDKHKMIKVKGFVVRHCKEFNSINSGFFAMVEKELCGLKVDTGCAYEYLKFGKLYCDMVRNVKPRSIRVGNIFFVNNVVDFMELSGCKRDDIFIVMENNNNLPRKKNVIYFGWFLNGQSDFVKDELLTRITVQLKVKKISTCKNCSVKKWISEHSLFIKSNNIDIEYVA